MIPSNSFWVHGSKHYEEYWFVLLEDMIREYDGIIQGLSGLSGRIYDFYRDLSPDF